MRKKKVREPEVKLIESDSPCEVFGCDSLTSYEIAIAYGRAKKKLAYSYCACMCKAHLNELRERISLTILNI